MNDGLGVMHSASFRTDPKHLGFVLARYKFVAKMVTGCKSVLEVGCGDKTGARLVQAVVGYWDGVDLDTGYDVTEAPYGEHGRLWDAVYALDVLEHIAEKDEDRALSNMSSFLAAHGMCIIGMPSQESQPYASELSRQHHVNCKTEDGLRATMQRHFHRVLMFGMSDEVVHTGYGPMCHYRLAIGIGRR